MDARRIPVSLRRDPREVAERHSQANPLTLYCELARGEEVTEALSLYAELHTSRTPQSSPVATAGPVAMAPAGTGPWELDFSAAQMNQTVLPGEDREYWLVVYATGANDLLLTLATIRLTLAYDNISQVTPAPPEPALILAFRTIAVAGQSPIVADTSADTLTLVAGNGVTLTTNASTDTLTIAAGGPFTDLEVTGTLTAAHIHGNLAGSVYTHVRNESGSPLAKGTPVYVTGFSVGQSRPLVGRADAASASTMPAIGILDEALANNASGHCVITGVIENLDTSGLSVNAPLYVASGGGLTATAPDVRAQPVAIVERVNVNTGAIIVTTAGTTGSLANQSAANVAITGGSISGLSSLGVIGGATFSATTAGSVSTSADILINGTRFGRGNGSISSNVFIGSAGASTLSGAGITCLGNGAGASMTSGGSNVAIGSSSLSSATTASQVVCVGSSSGSSITTQNGITAVGHSALINLNASTSSPAAVVAIGTNAGRFLANGSTSLTSAARSIFIGHSAYPLGDAQTNQIVIGDSAVGDGSNTTVIGRAATVTTRFAGTTTSAAIISGNELRIANSSTPAENAAGSIGAQRWDVNYQYVCTAINTTGAGITNAGTGGTNGTYRGVQLARVSGGTATEYPVVDIVISGTVVTSVTVVSGTAFSSAGNPIVMGLAAGQFAGGITGFQYTLETLTPTWKRSPLRSYSALIPISEGGTGASTTAGARANLGLETVVTDATTARTLASADAASYIRFTSSSAITITIPTNATDPIPIGSEYFIRRAGTGAISLSNAGVTVNDSDIANLATGRVCCLKKVATNEWDYIP